MDIGFINWYIRTKMEGVNVMELTAALITIGAGAFIYLLRQIRIMKDNHLHHIEKSVHNLEKDIVEIKTILNERLPNSK